MSINTMLKAALVCAAIALPALQACAGESEWHFKVTNATSSPIKKLQVSTDNKTWGDFDVGSGIGPGKTETMVWDSSTDGENCEQWIRAKFADGSTSPASKQDFCADLESPIEFSEG